MALIDQIKMLRTTPSLVKTDTPANANAYWQTKSMEERLEALELTREALNPGYDPDTSRIARVLEVVKGPY